MLSKVALFLHKGQPGVGAENQDRHISMMVVHQKVLVLGSVDPDRPHRSAFYSFVYLHSGGTLLSLVPPPRGSVGVVVVVVPKLQV